MSTFFNDHMEQHTIINQYPPDMQLLATETVLKQAEMIANELADKSDESHSPCS